MIQVDVKLSPMVEHTPAQPVLLYVSLMSRLEILAVESRAVTGWRQVTTAG
jgi:hypothetical protein